MTQENINANVLTSADAEYLKEYVTLAEKYTAIFSRYAMQQTTEYGANRSLKTLNKKLAGLNEKYRGRISETTVRKEFLPFPTLPEEESWSSSNCW